MRKFIAIIQSVTEKEWEVGEMLCDEINNNPDFSESEAKVFYVKTFQELKDQLNMVSIENRDAFIIIVIYAHSDSKHLIFKDFNVPDKDYNDYIKWEEFDNVLTSLYKVHETIITVIFLSCHSSSYAKTVNLPHIPILAAEGVVSSRRAGEQLVEFFNKACTGSDTETAYGFMIESFPVEEEIHRNERDRSILKLYM